MAIQTSLRKPTVLSMKRFWIALAFPAWIYYASDAGRELRNMQDYFWLWFPVSMFIFLSGIQRLLHKRDEVSSLNIFNEDNNGIYFHQFHSGIGSAFVKERRKSSVRIDTNKNTITLNSEGNEKTYPIEDIKSWSYFLSGSSQVTGTDVTGVLMAFSMNNRERRESFERSGLFIKMRDVEFPEWQIMYHPRKGKGRYFSKEGLNDMEFQLKQWMEVLDQVTNQK